MSISNHNIKRRRLLEKLVTTSATLPFVSFLPSAGAAEVAQKRLVLMYSPNGTIPGQHFPTGGVSDFQLKRCTQPLEPHKNELNIFKGLENKAPSPGGAHARGIGALWTASKLAAGEFQGADGTDPVGWSTGTSIDQRIANEIGTGHRFKSLEYGVRVRRSDMNGRMIYSSPEISVPPEQDPYRAFSRLFDNFNQNTDEQIDSSVSVSVLDGLIKDLTRMRPYLSADDRMKLERHTDSVREIERSLATPDDTLRCVLPEQGAKININTDDNLPQLGKLFMDLMVAAFACNQSPVASLQFSNAVGQATYKFLNLSNGRGHHDQSHDPDSNAETLENLTKINQWYMTQYAYMIQQMKDTPDPSGDGSLLDNSLVIYGNSLGKGNTHTRKDLPIVMAGSCQGHFQTGRFLNYSTQQNHAKFLTSVLGAYGINAAGYGDYGSVGKLANLT